MLLHFFKYFSIEFVLSFLVSFEKYETHILIIHILTSAASSFLSLLDKQFWISRSFLQSSTTSLMFDVRISGSSTSLLLSQSLSVLRSSTIS